MLFYDAVSNSGDIGPIYTVSWPRWAGYVERMAERKGGHRILVGKPEGRRPLRRPRRRWENNIKMEVREVGWRAWAGSLWLRIGTGGGFL